MDEGLRIIVGFDGSKCASRALISAASLAGHFNGSVTVFTGLIYPPADVNLNDNEIHGQGEMKKLDELEREARLIIPRGVSYAFEHDEGYDAADMILRRVKDEGFDLIVIGCRGLRDAESMLLGSVSHKIANNSHTDVLLIK